MAFEFVARNGIIALNNTTITGSLITTGTITSAALIRSGSTNLQILAGDGSVITAGTNITISGGTISATGGGGGGGGISGSGVSGQLTYWNGTTSVTGSTTLTYSPTGAVGLSVSPTLTAATNLAQGVLINPTLTAISNSDVTIGLDISPTFSNGAFTSATNYALRTGNVAFTGTLTNPTADLVWNINSSNRNVQIGTFGGVVFSGSRNVALGSNTISATNANTITIGTANTNSSTTNAGIVIGSSCTISVVGVVIGRTSTSNFAGSVVIGSQFGVAATQTQQFVCEPNDWWIGNPANTNATTNATSLNVNNGSGTNINANIFRINGGRGTGTGTAGDIAFQTATPTTTGTTLQTLTERLRIFNTTGNVLIQNGGTFTDIASSLLTMVSTTKGFLPPRMTTAQKNAIGTPATGLVVYDTTLNKLAVYTGAAWETVTST
jgi:hypothetical protein